MITSKQIAAGRALLGISQVVLAQWAGLSRATLSALEAGHDSKVSSLEAVTHALQSRGIIFYQDGGLAQKMTWGPNGRPADPVIARRIMSGMNTARQARHNPLLVDDPEDE